MGEDGPDGRASPPTYVHPMKDENDGSFAARAGGARDLKFIAEDPRADRKPLRVIAMRGTSLAILAVEGPVKIQSDLGYTRSGTPPPRRMPHPRTAVPGPSFAHKLRGAPRGITAEYRARC